MALSEDWWNEMPELSDLQAQTDWAAAEQRVHFQNPEPQRTWVDGLLKRLFPPKQVQQSQPEINEEWKRAWGKFRGSWKPGDQLWWYHNGRFNQLEGRAGYAIVRDGRIVAGILVILN
jgi:hypothetical protein